MFVCLVFPCVFVSFMGWIGWSRVSNTERCYLMILWGKIDKFTGSGSPSTTLLTEISHSVSDHRICSLVVPLDRIIYRVLGMSLITRDCTKQTTDNASLSVKSERALFDAKAW